MINPSAFILILLAILVLILGIENKYHAWAAGAEARK
jgi:hypothetical protein